VNHFKEYLEDSILSEVQKSSENPNKSGKEETMIEAVYDEEVRLNYLPAEQAIKKVHEIIHKHTAEIANRISKKAAKKIAKNSKLKSAENETDKKEIIKNTVQKIVKKVVKKEKKKAMKKAQGRVSAESLIVKSTKSLLKGENLNNIVDVVYNLYQ